MSETSSQKRTVAAGWKMEFSLAYTGLSADYVKFKIYVICGVESVSKRGIRSLHLLSRAEPWPGQKRYREQVHVCFCLLLELVSYKKKIGERCYREAFII